MISLIIGKSFLKKILICISVINMLTGSVIQTYAFVHRPIATVIFMDVGQGDGTLIVTESKSVLIDGGEKEMAERVLLPVMNYYGVVKTDITVMSHLHSDHGGGLLALSELGRVGRIGVSAWGEGKDYEELVKGYDIERDCYILGYNDRIQIEDEVEMPAAAATAAPAAPELAADAGGMGGARALDQAAELPPDMALREEFADTAFWDTTVTTDQTGRASVTLTLPDNLTTWVMRGVGVTGRTEVGEATADLLVTKPLLVRPITPRFFVVGDRVQLAALVSNNTGQDQQVTVTLHGEGMSLADPATQVVAIPDGAEAKVSWWVTIEDVATVDLAMSATAGDYSDAARPRLTTGPDGTLLVHRYTAPEIVGTGGQLVGEDVRVEAIALPPKYDDRRGELSIRLDPSLAAGMVDGLDYLEHFPYECTEQTVSRFLPNMLTYRALQSLGISDPELDKKLPGLIEEGLQKLYAQQQSDGGWGWWAEGASSPHLSAYVAFALVSAERGRGTFVKPMVLGAATFGLKAFEDLFVAENTTVRFLSVRTIAATSRISRALGVPVDNKVISIRRLLSQSGVPVAYHREYLIFDPSRPIVEAEMGLTSLQGLFEGRGETVLKRGDLTVETTTIIEEESRLLRVPVGAAAFRIEHTFYDFEERAVSWGWFIVRGDRLRFQATVGAQAPASEGGR